MTKEEAKNLVKPLAWKNGSNGAIYSYTTEAIPHNYVFILVSPGIACGYYEAHIGTTELSRGWGYLTVEEAKSAAEEWYTNFVLGFLNLEGGTE